MCSRCGWILRGSASSLCRIRRHGQGDHHTVIGPCVLLVLPSWLEDRHPNSALLRRFVVAVSHVIASLLRRVRRLRVEVSNPGVGYPSTLLHGVPVFGQPAADLGQILTASLGSCGLTSLHSAAACTTGTPGSCEV